MASYKYKARDEEGNVISGRMKAVDENDLHEKDVGGKYSDGTYGSALTMEIRGNFPDNEGGSGISKYYYRVFNNEEVTIDETKENGQKEGGKIYFRSLDGLKEYVIENKTDTFTALNAGETRNVEYNITPADPVTQTQDRLGGGTPTNGYSLTTKGYVQYRKEIKTNYKTTIKGFAEGKNYLVLVAEDNAGNTSVDYAQVPAEGNPSETAVYACYSLNVDITAPSIPAKHEGNVYSNVTAGDSTTVKVNISGTVSDKPGVENG